MTSNSICPPGTPPAERVRPSVGRIVHYVSHGTPPGADGTQAFPSKCRAAVIADVYSADNPHPDPEVVVDWDGGEWVALAVLNPSGVFFNDACHDEQIKQGGTWHWPARGGA
ncbi:hypothetical protein AB0L66_10260 [Streptomyces sp. NPDC052207]|uniref:hypothetical protein n=1 Tax=Streptomyces sp. NPDC052207 TaxID=3155418 RepID=UPI00344A743C